MIYETWVRVRQILQIVLDLVKRDDANKAQFAAVRSEQVEQRAILEKLLAVVTPPPTVAVRFAVVSGGQIIEGVMHVQMKDTEKFSFSISPVDSKGNPSTIDPSKTTGAVDDSAIASVSMNADGVSGVVVAGKPGSTQLRVSVTDANNPGDVVTGTLDITVVAGDTASLQINTSAPEAQ